jgi:hypothetical protein
MLDKTNREDQILALHRYYCWTTLMKRDFEAALLKGDHFPTEGQSPLMWPIKYMAGEVGMYMSYWYGGLFVVCEGWQELGLSDAVVDALLDDPKLQILKRYRNGAFHFQKDYFDSRFMDFQTEQDSVGWFRDLSQALGHWFLNWFEARKTPSMPNESVNRPPRA